MQIKDLRTAHLSLVVWSAIMAPLQGLGQSTSVMMLLFGWGMRPESVRGMAVGMGAYPSACQKKEVCAVANFISSELLLRTGFLLIV